jgi:hypothetical protein
MWHDRFFSKSGSPIINFVVMNLLSQGFIRDDGTPGTAYKRAQQSLAGSEDKYSLEPHRAVDDLNRTLYLTLAELRKQQDWRLHTSVQEVTENSDQ